MTIAANRPSCPQCGQGGQIEVEAISDVTLSCFDNHGQASCEHAEPPYYDADSPAWCKDCEWRGTLAEFIAGKAGAP
jgi:hypothetical protein